jgi:FKBP-type peptidyl-prolyl cis-trans isomerase
MITLMPSSLHVRQIAPPADLTSPPADAIKTPTKRDPTRVLLSRTIAPGTGDSHPGPTSIVTVHYTAWESDGTTIDDSRTRGNPATWMPGQLMEGLSTGIQLMTAGEKRRLWIPASMCHEWATGTQVYEVELLAIAPPPPWPERGEVGNPPADATRSSSGLAFKVLRPGTGTDHPKPTSTVTIHYTEWTTSGTTIYDDSVARQEPLDVAVDRVMPGLAEALQRMVIGEKTRVWMPANLAYSEPMPRAALLFDIELLAIQQAVAGPTGTVRVQTNSPDATYDLIFPDGSPRRAKGPQTFTDAAPGRYRVKPQVLRSYAIGLLASPAGMTLASGATLEITISYQPIIR